MSHDAATDDRRQVQMSVRVPAELAEALEKVAEREDRTVSAELRRIIRQHIAQVGGTVPERAAGTTGHVDPTAVVVAPGPFGARSRS